MWLCPTVAAVLSHSYEELSLSPQVTWPKVARVERDAGRRRHHQVHEALLVRLAGAVLAVVGHLERARARSTGSGSPAWGRSPRPSPRPARSRRRACSAPGSRSSRSVGVPLASWIRLPVEPPSGSVPPGGGRSLLTCGLMYRSPWPAVEDGEVLRQGRARWDRARSPSRTRRQPGSRSTPRRPRGS